MRQQIMTSPWSAEASWAPPSPGGLAGSARRVCVLDEGDIAKRASRANFALVWVQSKGFGMPAYTGWTMRASDSGRSSQPNCASRPGSTSPSSAMAAFISTLGEEELEQRACC